MLDVFLLFFFNAASHADIIIISGSDFIHLTIIMNRLLKKKISLVAGAAAVAGVGAQRQRRGGGGGCGRNFFLRSYQSDDRALRIDGGANATAADAVPEVASIVNGNPTGGPLP